MNTGPRPLHLDTLLTQALGGVVPGSKILVVGRPDVGTAMLCAELIVQLVPVLRQRAYWLGVARNPGAIFALVDHIPFGFERMGVVNPVEECDPTTIWREVLGNEMRHEAKVVVDSLERWASGPLEQDALIEQLATRPHTCLVLSHDDYTPQLAQRTAAAFDAVAIVTPDHIEVPRCGWMPGPRVVPRPAMTTKEVAPRDEQKPQYSKGGTG